MGKLEISAKCSDMCSIHFTGDDGKVTETDGYVPEGIGIGDFFGDYVQMEIDMATGQILNWKPVTDEQVRKSLKKVS